MRITGCPNGCARPYMAELGFVGDGPKSYQVIRIVTKKYFGYIHLANFFGFVFLSYLLYSTLL